jgi:hypothetical protein
VPVPQPSSVQAPVPIHRFKFHLSTLAHEQRTRPQNHTAHHATKTYTPTEKTFKISPVYHLDRILFSTTILHTNNANPTPHNSPPSQSCSPSRPCNHFTTRSARRPPSNLRSHPALPLQPQPAPPLQCSSQTDPRALALALWLPPSTASRTPPALLASWATPSERFPALPPRVALALP